ncbi:hypothetical protein ABW19_dt0201646 [Dactylella cylindrospora]|nr:hypothetical protein ABW19_dt0201646 [Dactylella cylindrospora]
MSQSKTEGEEARFTISPATDTDLPDVKKLFTLYAESLHIDLTFQSFAEELAGLPGKYGPPTGQILLAKKEISRTAVTQTTTEERKTGPTVQGDQREEYGDKKEVSCDSNLISSELVGRRAEAIGCVAVRPIAFAPPFDPGRAGVKTCEMKRLYTLPSTRGLGVGKALIEDIMKAAEQLGYEEMYLDTLSTMKKALSMYERFGFERTEPYYSNPHEGVVFLVKRLGSSKPTGPG